MDHIAFRCFRLLLLLLFVFQQAFANTAPTVPALVYPIENDPNFTNELLWFIWEKSNDVDADPVSYDLYIGIDELELVARDMGSINYANDSVVVVLDNEESDSVAAVLIGHLSPNTTYKWKIVARDGNGGVSESDTWSFTIGDINIYAPTVPDQPTPTNTTTNVDTKPSLSWQPSTDRDGHSVVYDIFLDTKSSLTNQIASGLTDPIFNVSQELQGNTQYFWKIVASDGKGKETTSTTWEFTTRNRPPLSAQLVSPQHTATDIGHNTNFSWAPSTDPDNDDLYYELWYGTTILPDKSITLDGTSISLLLSAGTTYYWKVVTIDVHGDRSESEVWSFTTTTEVGNASPSQPLLVFPIDAASEVVLEPTLQWQASNDTDNDDILYDLYLGPHPDSLKLEASELVSTSYDLILSSGNTWYWQIVAYDRKGGVVGSEIREFATTTKDVELALLGVYYRYRHPSLLFEYTRESMMPEFDVSIPDYLTRGKTDMTDAVVIALFYDNPSSVVSVDVPNGFSVSESITYTRGLPNDAARTFKIEGDFSLGATAKVTLQQGVAIRTYEVELTVNQLPTKPLLLTPGAEEADVDFVPTFTWEGGDDPDGGDMIYRILLGTSADALRPFGFTFNNKSYQGNLQALSPGQQYVWKVVATDRNAETIESSLSYFRTKGLLNEGLSIRYPREISTYVDTETELIWSFNTADTYHYEVFLDVNPNPRSIVKNVSDTRYAVQGLAHDTKYYWKVVSHNDQGVVESTEVRQFTTKPMDGNETGIMVDDRDGQVYQWANINGYKWMTHNLAYEPSESDGYYGYEYWHTNKDASKKSYSLLLHQDQHKERYGYLYDWNAAINPDALSDTSTYMQGVCPSGWQVAPREAWNTFYPLDFTTTLHHSTWFVGGKQNEWLNKSGLSLLPSGSRLRFAQTPFESGNNMQFWYTEGDRTQRSILYQYLPSSSRMWVSTGSNVASAAVRCVKISADNNAPTSPVLQSPGFQQSALSLPVRFEWTQATDADGNDILYEVYVDTVAVPKYKPGQNIRNTFYEMDELSPNTTYYWKVRAKDHYGDFGDSEVWSFTTNPDASNAPPESPTLLVPVASGQDVPIQPTLFTWQAASDPQNDPVTYNFHLGIRPEFQTQIAKDIVGTSFEISELESGTTYYWKVVAKDGRGGLSESDVRSFTTFNRPPTAPQLLAPINGNEGNLIEQTLSWGRSTDPDGDPVSYRLFIGQSPDNFLNYGIINGRSRYIFGNAIPNNTTFYWKVVATDGKGGETSSELWTYKTHDFSGSIKPALKSPANLSTNVSLNPTLEWEKAPNTSFTYDVYVDDILIANDLTTDSYTINTFLDRSGLSPHKTYTWTVIAKNVHGAIGEPEPKEWRFTTVNAPPTPAVLISPAANAQDVAYDPTLTWHNAIDPDGSILVTYDLYLDNNPNPSTLVASGQDTTYTANWLTPNATYYWKVVATDPYEGKTSSEIRSFTIQNNTVNSAPSAPDLISPSNFDGQQSATTLLTWHPSRDIDADPITYDVYMDSHPVPSTLLVSGLTDAEYSATGLLANTPYYWKVVAKDDQSAATSSDTWLFNIKNTLPESPVLTGPTNVGKLTGTSTTLTWAAASDADGEVVTYDVYLDQAPNPTTQVSTGSTDLNYTTNTLQNNAKYYWKVVARDPQGGASSSEIWSFSGQNEAPLAPVIDSPVSGAIVGSSTITLQWQPSIDSDNSDEDIKYEVHMSTDSNQLEKAATVLQATSYTVSDLAENTPYYWKVIADDGEGGTASTGVQSFTYQSAAQNQKPTAPNLLLPADRTQDVANSISLSWDVSTDPEGDNVSYRLYINQALISTVTTTTFDLSHLAVGRTYIWQVVAVDEKGNQNESPSWQFTTANQVIEHFTISGTIQDAANNSLADVTLQGLPQSVKTNAQGNYTAQLPRGWNGTITPSLTDYSFNPTEIQVNGLTSNLANQDFTGRYTGDYILSGKVLDANSNPLANVSIGGVGQTVTTNAQGEYSIQLAQNWSGTITPSLTDYSFTPTEIVVSSLTSDQTDQDFTGRYTGDYTLSGKVLDANSNPLGNVHMNGFSQTVTTNANGEFSTDEAAGWSGSITPELANYEFDPVKIDITSLDKNRSNLDFAGTVNVFYEVSGIIKDGSGAPVPQVSLSGFPQATKTNAQGEFSAVVPHRWSGTIRPQLSDYSFQPTQIVLSNVTENQINQDFTATLLVRYTISGKVTDTNDDPLSDVVIEGFNQTVRTSATGEFSMRLDAGATGTLTAALEDYEFSPASQSITNLQADRSQLDFKGTYTGNYEISGKVLDQSNAALAQVAITGLPKATTTDENGEFKSEVPAGWSGTMRPQLVDYTFAPSQIALTNVRSSKAEQNFAATYVGNYLLAGQILNGSGAPLAQVSLNGFGQEIMTDMEGRFSVEIKADWSGTITPVLSDYEFSPADFSIDKLDGNITDLRFEATYTGTYEISGLVLDQSGAPMAQVQIAGLSETITTSAIGEYRVDVPAGWNGTLTPSFADYAFEPSRIVFDDVGSDQSGNSFTGTYVGDFTLSGTVLSQSGEPLSEVVLEGFDQEVMTNTEGKFSIDIAAGWTGLITPRLENYEFSPSNIAITSLDSDRDDLDFEGTYIGTYEVSGQISDQSGEPLVGVSLAGLPEDVVTDELGLYKAEIPAQWNGTITPMLSDYTFEPASVVLDDVSSDKSNQSFVATYIGDYAISGIIVDGSGEPAVGVVLSGFPEEVITDASGEYSTGVSAGWSGTVIPEKEESQFIPPQIVYTDIDSDLTNQDFLWVIVNGLDNERSELIKIYPNPSDGNIVIELSELTQTSAELRILGLQGRVIQHIHLNKDVRSVHWDGTDENGASVPTGIYICQISIDGEPPATARIIIIR